jgi:hypothetical protein
LSPMESGICLTELSLTDQEATKSCVTAYPECMVRRLDASEK